MRILVDYRPALRERTGVGEYIHHLVRAYASAHPGELAVFTSSWKDRPRDALAADLGAEVIDRRVPVRVLNLLWHRSTWPPIESIAGRFDAVHAAHPLLIPSRRAAQIVTIHDLFFLSIPNGTRAEIRRDYASLARRHARTADAIVTSTQHGKRLVATTFDIDEGRIYVCPPGAPVWQALGRQANVPVDGYVLFVGTLEPRKNIGRLLDAYQQLAERHSRLPPLVLAGRATREARDWLARIQRPPLATRVRHLGYVPDSDRERLYAGARLLVLPSLDEGFGLTALEAMSAGVPVVASNRGSLPEVLGNAGTLIDPADVDGLAAAIERLVSDDAAAASAGAAGLARAKTFSWATAAETLRRAYVEAVARRGRR